MKYIYVAGPYTMGDVAQNVKAAIDASDALIRAGFAPYCPHLRHFQHLAHPHPYSTWTRLDFAWLAKCDALLRLPGASAGADAEVEYAREIGVPVFDSIEDILHPPMMPPLVLGDDD